MGGQIDVGAESAAKRRTGADSGVNDRGWRRPIQSSSDSALRAADCELDDSLDP